MSSPKSRASRPPRVPSFCHHRASGQAYIKAGGKMAYLGVNGADACRTAYAAAVADVLAGREVVVAKRRSHAAPSCLTVRDVCDRFHAHAPRLLPQGR